MKYPILGISLIIALSSCNLDIPTENELTDPYVVVSEQTAYETLASAYHYYPLNHFQLTLLSDDFVPLFNARKSPNDLNTYYWLDFQLERLAETMWTDYYACIKDINAVLTRLLMLREKAEVSPLAIARIEAEAKSLKALCYLELLQVFASPLDDADERGIILKDNVEFEELPRSDKEQSLKEIKSLLTSAEQLFLKSKDFRPMHNGAANFLSLSANRLIQSRLALLQKDYAEAERLTKLSLQNKAISLNDYPLNPADWERLGKKSSLFSASSSSDFYLGIYSERPDKGSIAFGLNPQLRYEAKDKRKSVYTIDSLLPEDIQSNRLMLLIGKYTFAKLEDKLIKSIYIIRPVEALFICAEALARQGKTAEAIALLNEQYFKVLGLEPLEDDLRQEAFLDRLFQCKQKEFAGENIRFFDLKRLGESLPRLDYNGQSEKFRIKADDYRWTLPIPKCEYRSNRKLIKQNRGWRPFQRVED